MDEKINLKMDKTREQREQRIVRSFNSNHKSFIRFINTTPHCVTLYWVNYQGQAVKYSDLSSGSYIEIDTYHTHPWIFVNEETGVRYLVEQHDVFFPEPWFVKYRGLKPSELPRSIERTNVHIVLPLLTLQQLSLTVIKKYLMYDSHAFFLDIPRSLQLELFSMLPRKPLAS